MWRVLAESDGQFGLLQQKLRSETSYTNLHRVFQCSELSRPWLTPLFVVLLGHRSKRADAVPNALYDCTCYWHSGSSRYLLCFVFALLYTRPWLHRTTTSRSMCCKKPTHFLGSDHLCIDCFNVIISIMNEDIRLSNTCKQQKQHILRLITSDNHPGKPPYLQQKLIDTAN